VAGPPPQVAAVRAAVRADLADLTHDELVLVACSGGPDSVALAVATAFVAPRLGLRMGLVTVDHGLQDGSAAQAERVRALGVDLGFDHVEICGVHVGGPGGPEAAAREARYDALGRVARELGASAILLAHHRDDQAEQVLLGLARGSGARSLAGMPARRGLLRRPLLGLPRDVLAAVAAPHETWPDPMNVDTSLARARVRATVLPLLERELGPGIAAALVRTARLARDDADLLDELAAKARAGCEVEEGWSVAALAELPRALRTRVLRDVCAPVSAVHVDAVEALVSDWRGQGSVALPGDRTARRTAGLLVLADTPSTGMGGSAP
jgi:tRNA(Ile)-lysidine synthase